MLKWWLMILVGWVCCTEGWAQNNPYKIRDELYPIYRRAFYARRTTRGLLMADTLYREATRLGDNKAKCLAQTIRFSYAYNNARTVAELDAALKPLQDDALKYGYLQYYYNGVSNKVNFLIGKQKNEEAVAYINQQYEFAKQHNHHVGIYNAYLQLSEYYKNKGQNGGTEIALKNALEYAEKYLPAVDRSIIYRKLAECQEINGEYEQELKTIEKGLTLSNTPQIKLNLKHLQAFALFMLGRDNEFKACCQWLNNHKQPQGRNVYSRDVYLEAMALAVEHKYDRAIEMLNDSTVYHYNHTSDLLIEIYKRQGNYVEALSEQRSLMFSRLKACREVGEQQITELETKLIKQKLAGEKREADLRSTKLQLDNSKLQLENSNLELSRSRAAERLAKLNADNISLSYDNKKLETQKLRDSIRVERATQQNEAAESRRQRDILIVVFAAALAIIGLYYIYRLRISREMEKTNIQLRRNNNELQKAKARAESADKMKTMFIQNMSHEVRTPLNAVVGFSQVLTEMGGELTEEERRDMSHRISENASLLTTLINDILDITNIESGRYVMKMDDCRLNDLCRMSLATVEHRVAKGVKLLMESEEKDSVFVTTDGDRVKQVLINLLTNAAKNTEEGFIKLQCQADRTSQRVMFVVTDTGVGIPYDKKDAIFERFTKLDDFKQGAGLGLSICNIITQKLGGRLGLDLLYKDGARFFFSIPAAIKDN